MTLLLVTRYLTKHKTLKGLSLKGCQPEVSRDKYLFHVEIFSTDYMLVGDMLRGCLRGFCVGLAD